DEDPPEAEQRPPVPGGEPLDGLFGVQPRLARRLRAGDHEEDDGVEAVEGHRRVPREPQLAFRVGAQVRDDAHDAAPISVRSRSRSIACRRAAAITTIHSAMAMFLSQNDTRPSHAKGPDSASPAKPAGTRAMAMTTLNRATHRGKTGWASRA